MIQLHAKPHVSPLTWNEFLEKAPNHSIALDGYVSDETRFLPHRAMANINHHENVSRLATRCTASQIKLNTSMNMLDMFRNEHGEIEMNIFVNDCDEDVCLSYFLLKNASMSKLTNNPALNRLVFFRGYAGFDIGSLPTFC